MTSTECARPEVTTAPALCGRLFDRHGRDLYRFLARRVGAAADDLLSETFAVALERRHTYDGGRAAARAWLFGIATSLLRRHVAQEVHWLRLTARPDGPPDTPELVRDVAGVLAEMPAGDRDMLLLASWAELSPAEVAAALAIPVEAVRSPLPPAAARALAALHEVELDEGVLRSVRSELMAAVAAETSVLPKRWRLRRRTVTT